jgi:hypothetical protein
MTTNYNSTFLNEWIGGSIYDFRSFLMDEPGVYVVTKESEDIDPIVLYVGQSENISKRWVQGHHAAVDCFSAGATTLRYFLTNKRVELESLLIAYFQPPVNKNTDVFNDFTFVPRLWDSAGVNQRVKDTYVWMERPKIVKVTPTETKKPKQPNVIKVLDALTGWRLAEASNQGVPPYVVFHDRTLVEIANKLPKTISQLREVYGIGQVKLEQYGEQVLVCVQQALTNTSRYRLMELTSVSRWCSHH